MPKATIFFGLIVLIWIGVIFSFSLQPVKTSNTTSEIVGNELVEVFAPRVAEQMEQKTEMQLASMNVIYRKCAHFLEYFVLGILVTLTLKNVKSSIKYTYGLLFCIFVAGADETVQIFSDGRYGSIQDVLLDSLSALLGIWLVWWISYKIFQKKR